MILVCSEPILKLLATKGMVASSGFTLAGLVPDCLYGCMWCVCTNEWLGFAVHWL